MLTILECAILSGHIYEVNSDRYLGLKIRKIVIRNNTPIPLDKGWGYIPIVDKYMKPANPCFCRLYIKFRSGKATDAVIAVRGTDNFDNMMVDLESWSSVTLGTCEGTVLPKYLPHVLKFYGAAKRYLRQHFPNIHNNHIYLTGHSLGGALAQLIPLSAHHPHYAVVFNSPGCRNMPDIDGTFATFIINVNSKYGVINKIDGPPLGTEYPIDVPNGENAAKSLFEKFDAEQYQQARNELRDACDSDSDAAYLTNGGTSVLGSIFEANSPKPNWIHLLSPSIYYGQLASNTGHNSYAIWAQHSMTNLAQALQQTDNKQIAYKPVPVSSLEIHHEIATAA